MGAWCTINYNLLLLLQDNIPIYPIAMETPLEVVHNEMIDSSTGKYVLTSEGVVTETERTEEAILQGNVGSKEEMGFLAEKRVVEAELRYFQQRYPDSAWDTKNQHHYLLWNADLNQLVSSAETTEKKGKSNKWGGLVCARPPLKCVKEVKSKKYR